MGHEADTELQDPVPPVTPASIGPSVSPGASAEELPLRLHIRELELRNQDLEVQSFRAGVPAQGQMSISPRTPPVKVSMVLNTLPFRESEVDSYFSAFERIVSHAELAEGRMAIFAAL